MSRTRKINIEVGNCINSEVGNCIPLKIIKIVALTNITISF